MPLKLSDPRVRFARAISVCSGLLGVIPMATAQPLELDSEVRLSSVLLDRGEQIGAETLEMTLSLSRALAGGTAYAAAYRITPVGPDQAAFDDEFDYTLGYAVDLNGVSLDTSANWLTYPGEATDGSVELVAAAGLDTLPLSPSFTAFYDLDREDHGIEVTAGPRFDVAGLPAYGLARVGFVVPGDPASEARSYVGLEAGVSKALGRGLSLGGYIRAEWADADSFAGAVSGGQVVRADTQAVAAGLSLSFSR